MANQLDKASIVPRKIASGGKVTVELTYKAEQAGSVLVDFDPHLFAISSTALPVPASQGGFVKHKLTVTRLTNQTICVITFRFFNTAVDAVEVT